jgi:hypothetical protein
MRTVAIVDHRSNARRTAAKGPPVPSVAQIVAMVTAAAVVSLVIAWIVAASLGLGADGRPGVGPDRPPAPDLFRWTASGPTLPREAVVWKEGPS